MKTIVVTAGTRPEIIKTFPVVRELKARGASVHFCYSGQHLELAKPFLELFGLEPDSRLDAMVPGQSLAELTARAVTQLDRLFAANAREFGAVLVQGDTTTAFAASLAAFYNHLPVGHIEAGLRTNDISEPFPEELNRRLISRIARAHYAPTARARDALLAEQVPADRIVLTGNTGIDAFLWTLAQTRAPRDERLKALTDRKRLVLVTTHRRENIGEPLARITAALSDLAARHSDVDFVLPVHRNPRIAEAVHAGLAGRANVHLVEPLDYQDLTWHMGRAELILSDSGGIQEEAPSVGKTVLVLRNETERPEAVALGTSILVGSDRERITALATEFLSGARKSAGTGRANPYGDGQAARRIVDHLLATAT